MVFMLVFMVLTVYYLQISGLWLVIGGLGPVILLLLFNFSLYELVKMMSSWLVLDTISIGLMLLSVFLIMLMSLSSSSLLNTRYYDSLFNFFMLMLLMALLVSFMSSDFILFYFSFEVSLIPTLFIILGWGYQPERLQAGVYFMMYTLIASLPLLFSLVYLSYSPLGALMWDYSLLESCKWVYSLGDYGILLMLMMAFLFKLPMFMFHLWLPKAHVEAPVAGSMILAGVLLKLGGYGLSRVVMKFNTLVSINWLLVGLSLVGMVFVGLVCCRLNDLKALVAYSSVAHMGLVICGMASGLLWGLSGSVFMMISHGLGSSGLFCFMNMLYERSGSRSIFINKGVGVLAPFFSLMLFFMCCSNISAPPSINLMAEISLIISIFSYNVWSMLIFPLGTFLGAVFTFYLFSFVHHGKIFNGLSGAMFGSFVELHVLVMHLIPINLLLLKMDMFLSVI